MTTGIGGLDPRQGLPLGPQETQAKVPQTAARPSSLPLADGDVVEGRVMVKNDDGTYLVRVLGRELLARSTMDLFPGQAFRAQWQNGDVPLLKLLTAAGQGLLQSLSGRDLALAEALLSRGLPLGREALDALRSAWLRLGAAAEKLPALVELWARGLEMTERNVSVVVGYLALSDGEVSRLWKRLRERLSAKLVAGVPLKEALAGIRSDDGELGDLLSAMALLGSPLAVDSDGEARPLLRWPLEEGPPARVSVENGRGLWLMTFDLPLRHMGAVEGELHYDGRALAVFLRASPEGMAPIGEELAGLAAQLKELPLKLQHLGLSVLSEEGPRRYRGVDFEA